MEVTIKCPVCDSSLVVEPKDESIRISCGGCSCVIRLVFSQSLREDSSVDCCPVCRGEDFYLRKDFNPTLGVTVVIIGAFISGIFYWFGMDFIAYGVLAAAALLDLAIYQYLGEVTVCYRCHAEFRGVYPKTAPGFDLYTADVLELEYSRTKQKN